MYIYMCIYTHTHTYTYHTYTRTCTCIYINTHVRARDTRTLPLSPTHNCAHFVVFSLLEKIEWKTGRNHGDHEGIEESELHKWTLSLLQVACRLKNQHGRSEQELLSNFFKICSPKGWSYWRSWSHFCCCIRCSQLMALAELDHFFHQSADGPSQN